MAGSVNKVILIGNLGKDPEVRTAQNGTKIVNFTLATSESWNDKASGEKRERTEWHRVVVFNERIADVAERFLKKGRKVYVEGSLQTRKWTDQSGAEKYTTEVVIDRFRGDLTLIDSNRGGSASDDFGGGGEDGRVRPRRRPRAGRHPRPAVVVPEARRAAGTSMTRSRGERRRFRAATRRVYGRGGRPRAGRHPRPAVVVPEAVGTRRAAGTSMTRSRSRSAMKRGFAPHPTKRGASGSREIRQVRAFSDRTDSSDREEMLALSMI